MTSFQTGQRVKFLNDVGSATVVRVEGSTVVVEDEDGFERSVTAAELMAAPDPEVEARQYGDTIPRRGPTFGPRSGGEAHAGVAKGF